MAESTYDRKRRFEETPEPTGESREGDVDPGEAPTGDRFVIQQHHATRLHHDLRLEMFNGPTPVLVSWAVPKGLPRQRGERFLAIRTEDHPIEYATFTGAIPEGNYGAGEVRIFDSGTYEMVKRERGRLTFRLDGERLHGTYHLVQTKEMDGKEQWLALLSEDHRPPHQDAPPPQPMLATLVKEAFDDPDWGFEPKWDGIRAIATCAYDTRLVSRNGNDVTAGYPELRRLHEQLVAMEAMIDGEIVAFEDGVPSFQKLQGRMHVRDSHQLERLSRSAPVVFIAFDMLYMDGRNLISLPFAERRELLEANVVPDQYVNVSPLTLTDGVALFQAAAQQKLEGIVAKKLDSRYEPGNRSRSWLKIKTVLEADVVVAGWTEGLGRRSGSLGSLVVAVYDGGELRYAGNVGTGFTQKSLDQIMARLADLGAAEAPFPRSTISQNPELRKAHWVPPELVAIVEYRQLTGAGKLRAPSFKGLRDDKAPQDCTFDQLR